ncbi:MAG TPA: hypothetical protein VFB22_16335 [Candidatus Baltobacteraceae bacterium]|nr:hypothetical protein [Candidatus Baltobacteraceae bacterium]
MAPTPAHARRRAPLVVAAYAAAFACPVAIAALVALTVVDAPIYDEWIWSPLVLAAHGGTLRFADVWATQGAHRSVVPTLIALALARIDGWNVRVEAFAGVLLALATQLLLLRLFLRRCGGVARAAAPFLFASVLLWSLAQCENWLWGFQLSWFLTNLCAVAVVVLLDEPAAAAAPLATGFAFAAAATAAAVASFSLIFGFGAWVAGAVMLAVQREAARPRRAPTIAWLACGALCAVTFLHGYAAPRFENGWIGRAPAPPATAALFALTYLGAPLGIAGGWPACAAIGALFVAAFPVMMRLARRERVPLAPWAALGAYVAVAAAMETLGRGGNGVAAATAFRYTTVSSLAWIAACGLLAARASAAPRSVPAGALGARIARLALAAGIALGLTADLAGAFETLQLAGAQRAEAVALSHLRDVPDDELAQFANDPRFVRGQARRLDAARLSLYRARPVPRTALADPPRAPLPPWGPVRANADPPEIVALRVTPLRAGWGQLVRIDVETTTNAALVELRVGGYGRALTKRTFGRFSGVYRLPFLPRALQVVRDVGFVVVARNAAGATVSRHVTVAVGPDGSG